MVMRCLRFRQSVFLLGVMILVLLWIAPALPVSAATSTPSDGAQGINVDSKITVTFSGSENIADFSIDSTKITLTDTKYPKKPLKFDVMHDTNDPHHTIVIIPKLVKSSDPDFYLLDFQKEYKVSIQADALMYGPVPLGEPYEFTFKTVNQFSEMSKTDLNLLIDQYSPSGITLLVPSKHITYLDVSYASVDANKKPLAKPLTNVDITVDSSVAEIRTCFVSKNWVVAQKSSTSTNAVWNAGYAGNMTVSSSDGKKQVGKDIKIRAYDEYGRVIESYTVKVDPKGKKTEDFKNDNKLAGLKKLNELIADGGKKLIEILKVFPLDALQVETYLTD